MQRVNRRHRDPVAAVYDLARHYDRLCARQLLRGELGDARLTALEVRALGRALSLIVCGLSGVMRGHVVLPRALPNGMREGDE